MRGVIGKTRNKVLEEQSARNKNEQNEQKPKVELPLQSWQKAYGNNVKKEHFFKTKAKNEQLFKPKVELEIGMQTAVAAEPRTARNVHKWNNRTRDHFVDLVKQISGPILKSLCRRMMLTSAQLEVPMAMMLSQMSLTMTPSHKAQTLQPIWINGTTYVAS